MLITVLFILTKTWELSSYLPMEKWIRKSCCIHTMDYYLAIKRNETFNYLQRHG